MRRARLRRRGLANTLKTQQTCEEGGTTNHTVAYKGC